MRSSTHAELYLLARNSGFPRLLRTIEIERPLRPQGPIKRAPSYFIWVFIPPPFGGNSGIPSCRPSSYFPSLEGRGLKGRCCISKPLRPSSIVRAGRVTQRHPAGRVRPSGFPRAYQRRFSPKLPLSCRRAMAVALVCFGRRPEVWKEKFPCVVFPTGVA